MAKQHKPGPSYQIAQHQYSGQEVETHGLNHQGSDRDWTPSQQQQQQGGWLLPQHVMEVSHLWLKGTKTGSKQEHDALWWALKRVISSLTSLPTQLPITSLKAPYWSRTFPTFLLSEWLPFPQTSFLKSYISPLLTSLVTSALKMETEFPSKHWHQGTKPRGAKTQDNTNYTNRCETSNLRMFEVKMSNLLSTHEMNIHIPNLVLHLLNWSALVFHTVQLQLEPHSL
jgi:hypothetical protein